MRKEEFMQLIAEELEERARQEELELQDEYLLDDELDDWDNHTLSRDELAFDDYQDSLWDS